MKYIQIDMEAKSLPQSMPVGALGYAKSSSSGKEMRHFRPRNAAIPLIENR